MEIVIGSPRRGIMGRKIYKNDDDFSLRQFFEEKEVWNSVKFLPEVKSGKWINVLTEQE